MADAVLFFPDMSASANFRFALSAQPPPGSRTHSAGYGSAHFSRRLMPQMLTAAWLTFAEKAS
ncbi:hypothetical protein ECTW10119_2632 [Escherichia coli TW10119]|nr:hypothetical protein ECTW10119_2632 [Escherichia coli TW10119]